MAAAQQQRRARQRVSAAGRAGPPLGGGWRQGRGEGGGGGREERQKEWLAMAADVSGWRQSRGRRGLRLGRLDQFHTHMWEIYALPKPDITVQKALQHLVDYQQTHMGSAQF